MNGSENSYDERQTSHRERWVTMITRSKSMLECDAIAQILQNPGREISSEVSVVLLVVGRRYQPLTFCPRTSQRG